MKVFCEVAIEWRQLLLIMVVMVRGAGLRAVATGFNSRGFNNVAATRHHFSLAVGMIAVAILSDLVWMPRSVWLPRPVGTSACMAGGL